MGRLQGKEQPACNISEIKKKKKKKRKKGEGEEGQERERGRGGEEEEGRYPGQDGVNSHTAILTSRLFHR